MVVAAALVSFWQEWRAATLVGLCGFGVPGVLRAALLAAVAGLCLPFAAAGVRRYQHG